MLAAVNQCDNKTSVIVFRKYGPKGYEKLEYTMETQGFRQGNWVWKSCVLDNIPQLNTLSKINKSCPLLIHT